MVTRHLIAVQIGGEYKIAQYGQWDGYPNGQGKDVLEFLLDKRDREALRKKVPTTRWLSDDEARAIQGSGDECTIPHPRRPWKETHPWLSRDAGADVLGHVVDQAPGLGLRNEINFAGDSCFCEWAYVVDFDRNTFEVFEGFNETPLESSERFADVQRRAGYEPVRCVRSWSLDKLPTVEEFVALFADANEEVAE